MLTAADDYPIHQTAEPIAFSGTDRNFYDRYFFNGSAADGTVFFAVAFGVYPHLDVADAHVSVLRDGRQVCLHASRHLAHERMALEVGPISILVEVPLRRLRVRVTQAHGIAADMVFEGRAFPIQEPRFTLRNGSRTVMDVTRMTQNGHWSGWITVDGQRHELSAGAMGTRDRSWGVRPVGAPDAQPVMPARLPQFFWLWAPTNFSDRSVFFHVNEDAAGRAWNTRAMRVPDGATREGLLIHDHEFDVANMEVAWRGGTRWARSARLEVRTADAETGWAEFLPDGPPFQMSGIGYGHSRWAHGVWKGDLVTEREEIDTASIDPLAVQNLHIQQPVRVEWRDIDGSHHSGRGVLEQLVIGPHAPSRLRDVLDGAP
jgi:hypothetical protein